MAGVVGEVGTRRLFSEFPVLCQCLDDAACSSSKVPALCVDIFVDVGPLLVILTIWAWMTMVGAAESCGRMGMSKSMSVAFKLVVGRCSEGGRVVLDEFDHVEAVVVINWAAVGFSGNVASLWDATMYWGVVVLISCRLYGLGFNGCKLGRGGR